MIGKTKKFFIEVKQELSKVSWSNRRELMGATVVVITSTFLLAIYIGLIDLMFSKFLSIVIK